jgi:histidine triad (HIT) family protein
LHDPKTFAISTQGDPAMTTLFTKIIQGEIPAHKIAEDERHLAFLDIRPVKRGHTLVIPKRENDYFFALSDAEIAELMVFAKKVAAILEKAIPCERIGMMVAGLEVPHTHVHLIPMDRISDLTFANARQATAEELEKTAVAIRSGAMRQTKNGGK